MNAADWNAISFLIVFIAMPIWALLYGEWEENARRRIGVAIGNLIAAAGLSLLLVTITRTKFSDAGTQCLLLGASYYVSSLVLRRHRYALILTFVILGGLVCSQNATLKQWVFTDHSSDPSTYHRFVPSFRYYTLNNSKDINEQFIARLQLSLAGRSATDETTLIAGAAFNHPQLKTVFNPDNTKRIPRRETVTWLWHSSFTDICLMKSEPQLLFYPGGSLRDGLPALRLEEKPEIVADPGN